MYEKFFGFTEPPFKQTPDPQFFYPSHKHEDAFSLILHGITYRKGFIVITGEVGTGKTTLSRRLLEALDPSVRTALILNPGLTTIELLQSVNQEFGIGNASASKKELVDELTRFLLDNLKAGGSAVLLIDEAQNLSVECLEEIRLLSNLETAKEKLLQIVLLGQPELGDKLRLNELRQLAQRIALHNHLLPLDLEETRMYIASRLSVVGWKDRVLFTTSAVERVYALSGGIPRLINTLCDKALYAAYAKETKVIGDVLIEEAVSAVKSAPWVMPRTTPLAEPPGLDRQPPRIDTEATVRIRPSTPYVPDRKRPRVRVTPFWVGLVCFLVVGIAGAFYWLVPTWVKVNENLTGTGKPPPPVTLGSELAGPGRSGSASAPAAILAPQSGTAQQSLRPASPTQPRVPEPAPVPQAQPAPPVVSPSGSTAPLPPATTPETGSSRAFTVVGVKEARPAAMLALLQRWGRFRSAPTKALLNRDPNSLVRESGLQSSTLPVELRMLERLDYPCLVEWRDEPSGKVHAVVLVSLSPTEVTILDPLVGRRVVDRAQFPRHVKGEALVLWKALPGIKVLLKPKRGKDPLVAELQRVLEKEGLFEGAVNGVYNPATRAALIRLQSEFGLKETGIFGVQSYMVLSKLVLGSEVPSLKAKPDPAEKQGT